MSTRFSRRRLLSGGAGLAAGAAVLAGCGSRSTATTAATKSGLDQLGRQMDGQLLRGGDQGFLAFATPTAMRYARSPQAVAVCASTADVRRALAVVRAEQLPFAVRCGGHNYAGYSTSDGLVISVGDMKGIEVQADGSVKVGAGAVLGDVATALQPSNVMIPSGRCNAVGISGLTLGGGWGFYARKYGLTCDSLIETEIVAADGSVLTASATENSDLFWALRGGGGGNFGVNTSFTFRTFPTAEPVSVFQMVWWDWSQFGSAIEALQRISVEGPHELSMEVVTAPQNNRPVDGSNPLKLSAVGHYFGPSSELASLLAPVTAVHPPAESELLDVDFWTAHQYLADATPVGWFSVQSSFMAAPFSDAGVTELLRWIQRWPGGSVAPDSNWGFFTMGGQVNALAPGATAYVHRNAELMLKFETDWASADPATETAVAEAWLREFYAAMQPHVLPQAYQNFINRDLPNWPRAYYGANLERLVNIKRHYDPDNVFAFAQSIPLQIPT